MTWTLRFDSVPVKPCMPPVASRRQASLLDIASKDVYMTGAIVTWVSGKSCCPVPPLCIQHFATDFLNRYLSTSESSRDTTLHSPSPTPILREWAKSTLTGGSWGDALVSALNVSTPFCSGAPRSPDTPLARSLQPRDSRFIGLSVTISKRPIA